MPKNENLSPLSTAQLEIMNLVWAQEEVTVTRVWNALQQARPVARTTVLTVMDRLEKKGWLKRRAEGQQHIYTAARSRKATLGQIVSRLVQTACAGSAEDLVLALLDGRGVTGSEAKRICELIEKARRKRS